LEHFLEHLHVAPGRLLLLIVSRSQLEHVLRVYVENYNTHRPHRALDPSRPCHRLAFTPSTRIRPRGSSDASASADSSTNTPEEHDGRVYVPHADADLEFSRQLRDNLLVAVETQEIVGREEELGALVACLEQAQRRPRDIVLEGEAGIGKTTLWRHAVGKAQAHGYRVLSCTPGEAETHLTFSGLRDLLDAAYEDVADALPPPQRRALDIALLRAEPGPQSPDQGAMAAAFFASLRLFYA
jgi:hypothetical protein